MDLGYKGAQTTTLFTRSGSHNVVTTCKFFICYEMTMTNASVSSFLLTRQNTTRFQRQCSSNLLVREQLLKQIKIKIINLLKQ